LQHINYEAQLVIKKLMANESLQRIGKIFVPPGNPLHDGNPWRYRNKSQYPVSGPPWRVGFFQRQTHRVVDIARCLVQPELLDRIRETIKSRLEDSDETPYSETSGTGNLRHIILKYSSATGQAALGLVTAGAKLSPLFYQGVTGLVRGHRGPGTRSRSEADRVMSPRIGSCSPGLSSEYPELVSIVQNINPHQTNRITGEVFRTLAGGDAYSDKLLGKTFRISAGSFFQANTAATELLVKRVLKYLDPDGSKTVLDVFCGVGTITLPIAGFAGDVIGIEVNPWAAADARANIEQNGIKNVQVIEASAEQGIASVARADAVILDPPRKGCSPELLRSVARLKPGAIIYVSCNPTTLARDLSLLRESGYQSEEIQLVDMFPQTSHIESVAKLVPIRETLTAEAVPVTSEIE
jgi:23S rRNA (uracil1939-C5)-methyltransferase